MSVSSLNSSAPPLTKSGASAKAPVVSNRVEDLDTPGVVIEVDAETAAAMGAFEETALTEEDAWEANADLEPSARDEIVDGGSPQHSYIVGQTIDRSSARLLSSLRSRGADDDD